MRNISRKFFRSSASINDDATQWLARRDRGLSAEEHARYLQWLQEDDRHAAAIAHAEETLRLVMKLGEWRDALSAEPNPDLFAGPRRHRWLRSASIAAAAAVVAGFVWWTKTPSSVRPSVAAKTHYLRVNERRVLPDGSRAELKDGSTLEVRYTATERRVRLTGGEAQFSVMKDAARPFVVEAGGVAVRAIGTVFDVRLDRAAVEVLVTEGKVRVGLAAQEPGKIFQSQSTDSEPPSVAAGQRAVVSLAEPAPIAVVAEVSPEEIRRNLAWQAPRLQFDETPLADAIAEFNQRNHQRLVLEDPALGALTIGGAFRPDNVDGFVRLLSVTLGLRAVPRGPDETLLVRSN